jgi:hypothetical protein
MLEHFKKRKDNKIAYLPFHNTWDKKTIITEVYVKPDEYEGRIEIWFIKEYDTYYSQFDVFYFRGFLHSSQIVIGDNGFFGQPPINMFYPKTRGSRSFSYELTFVDSMIRDINREIIEYAYCEKEIEESIYKLNIYSDIRLKIECIYLSSIESERSCNRGPPFN